MSRILRSTQLVSMPRLDIETAVGLSEALVKAGGMEKLTKRLSAALSAVERAGADLAKGVEQKNTVKMKIETERKRVRLEVKASWNAIQHLLTAWMMIPGEERTTASARRVKRVLIEEIRLHPHASHQQAWETIAERMSVIAAQDLDRVLVSLGARKFLEAARRSHRAYGEALGLVPETGPAPRNLLTAFVGAVRRYVEVATARAEANPNAKPVSLRLLAPLAELQQIQMRTETEEVAVVLKSDLH